MESGSSAKLMRGRADQSRQGSLDPISLNASDSNQRVRHRGSEHVEPIGRVRRGVVASATVRRVLVETAPKRSRMRRRRAHTPLLRGWDWTASVALEDLVTVWRDGAVVDGEPNGGRE